MLTNSKTIHKLTDNNKKKKKDNDIESRNIEDFFG